MADRFAEVAGLRIHYVEEGSGPLVVLLHGFPEFWYSWRKQIPELARAGFRVIAPDLRGYNDSDKPRQTDAYFLTEIVKDIAGLIVQSGDTPCVVVGHDWGGAVAWYLAMIHPELVSKLIILNSPHPVPWARELRRSKQQKLRASYQLLLSIPVFSPLFMRLFGTKMLAGRFTDEEKRVYKQAWKKPRALRSMLAYYPAVRRGRGRLRSMVRRIDVPVLLIWGERDPVFLRAVTEDFGEWVPDLRIERIAKAGHFVQTDAAERVTELILDFVLRVAPPPPAAPNSP